MRKLLVTCLMIWTPGLGLADGLTTTYDDPVVMTPENTWTGPYAGVSYGRDDKITEMQQCFKLDTSKACDDPIFDKYPEFKRIEISSTESTEDLFGVFAGYRHDFGRIVAGVELGHMGEATTFEGQVGADLGRVLIYTLAGVNDDSDTIYGAGADVRLGRSLLLGVKATNEITTLRVGVKF